MRLNPEWVRKTRDMIDEVAESREENSSAVIEFDETYTFNAAAKFVISQLARYGIPFKVYHLGAGVKRITTKTDTCPCCKRRIKNGKNTQ